MMDCEKKDIFFIVPAYNEGTVLDSTLRPVLKEGYSVVVVDDGSWDGSWDIIKKMPLYALRHPINLGQGAALQTGMTFALSKGAKVIVTFDADGQHRLKDVAVLLEPVIKGEAKVALGSRFINRDDKNAVPFLKRVLLKMAIIVNGIMTGLWLTDAHNGLRVLSRDAAEKIFLHENSYAHATEIINQIRRQKLSYVEKPVRIHYSQYSRAKGQSVWNAVNILIDLLLRRVFK
ncbi:MAG TPA: glycosyltransferase family 2 protein [Candidatus Omnitrophota bacterium]|nr:glycosyltransferase family 2 protein [Candidatus Omnitrophota bacterium]